MYSCVSTTMDLAMHISLENVAICIKSVKFSHLKVTSNRSGRKGVECFYFFIFPIRHSVLDHISYYFYILS